MARTTEFTRNFAAVFMLADGIHGSPPAGQGAMRNSPQVDRPTERVDAETISLRTDFASIHQRAPRAPSEFSNAPGVILLAIATLSLAGVGFALWLRGVTAGIPDPRRWYNVFYVLFASNEVAGLSTVALFSFLAAFLLFRSKVRKLEIPGTFHRPDLSLPLAIAFGVFLVATAGTYFVSHNYALSADENMADFQARIFLRGQISAEIPEKWADAVRVIKPTYVDYFPAAHTWKSAYLPVYAVMRALFQSVHLESLLNPFLAGLTVLAMFGTARNIWPEEKENAFVAAALLAVSAQFLLMATTAYSMPAHLALNTIWLWLYTQPDRRRFYLAPFVGILALGLHQPTVHALFVAPFLFRLVLQRKWRVSAIFAGLYLAGLLAWLSWRAHYSPPHAASDTFFFRLFNPRMVFIQPMDLLLLIGWSSLATPLLAILGFRKIFRRQPLVQDAALSCFLTFGFYYFFYLDQGHGWGYRYFHGALGCLVLVAAAGWKTLVQDVGAPRARMFLLLGLTTSVLVQLPLRCLQVERFVRPYAKASEMMQSIDADVVAFNPMDAWYSGDLVRNDPFLEDRPILVRLSRLTQEEVDMLATAGRPRFVTKEELARCGLATEIRPELTIAPFKLGLRP